MNRFSVIIPLYNKQQYIEQTIQSVLNQTYRDFEIIIINDSSTDMSLSIVEKFHDQRIHLYTVPNGGVSAARNFGMLKAKGEVFSFLDADDCWKPEYLECMNKLVNLYPNAGLYASAYYTVKSNKKVSVNKRYWLNNDFKLIDYFKESVKNGLSINITSATCIRKDVFLHIGFFRPHVSRGEDLDYWLRIALKYSIAFCNRELVFYRSNSLNSLSAYYTKNNEFPYEEWLKYKSSNPVYSKYVILAIYIFAKNAFLNKDYSTCYNYIWLIRTKCVSFKTVKRLVLFILSAIKK